MSKISWRCSGLCISALGKTHYTLLCLEKVGLRVLGALLLIASEDESEQGIVQELYNIYQSNNRISIAWSTQYFTTETLPLGLSKYKWQKWEFLYPANQRSSKSTLKHWLRFGFSRMHVSWDLSSSKFVFDTTSPTPEAIKSCLLSCHRPRLASHPHPKILGNATNQRLTSRVRVILQDCT